MSRPGVLSALLLGVLSCCLLWNLGYAPLWNPDEGRYSAAALEMIGGVEDGHSPDWVVPHLNTVPRLNKPPLTYWLTGTFFQWFGPHEWTSRLVSALAAIASMLIIWRLGRAMFSPATGLLAAMVWATSAFPFIMGRVGNTDMLLTFCIALAMWGLWGAAECGVRSAECEVDEPLFRVPHLAFIVAGIGFGLAMLTKGPVGVALPLLVAGVWLALTWRWRAVNWMGVAIMFGVMLLLAAPWYIAIAQREPEFLKGFFLGENLARFSGGTQFHDETPFWYYAPILLLGLMPWTPILIAALARVSAPSQTPEHRRARSFLWLWLALITLFFSASSTKLISYVLPVFPALALLLGEALGGFIRRAEAPSAGALPMAAEAGWGKGWRIGMGMSAFLFNTALSIGAGFMLLNDKTIDQDVGTIYLIIVASILFFNLLAFAGALSLDSRRGAAAVQGVTSVALFLVLLHLANTISYHEDASPMVRELKPHLKEGGRLVQYETFAPTAIFYLQRPITFIGYENRSGLDHKEFDSSPYFVADRPGVLIELLERPQPVYILLRRRELNKVVAKLPRMRGYIVGRNNDYVMWSNRRDAQDYFHHVAPRNF